MKILRSVAISALLALPILAYGLCQDGSAAEPKKATSIDELAKMYDSTGCKQCHEGIYK